MTIIDGVVIAAGLGLIAFLLWFFFGQKQGKAAVLQGAYRKPPFGLRARINRTS